MVSLFESIGTLRELRYWLKHYGRKDGQAYAVAKVGGGVIADENQLRDLCTSLAFLRRVGLYPMVVHGGGPQLNEELAAAGIVSDYWNGQRITTPEILRVARRVFQAQNLKLVEALERHGCPARGMPSSVFEAELAQEGKIGLVGEVRGVDLEPIEAAIRAGCVPVLYSLGESPDGQLLNINADIAARALSEEVQPLKVVYISEGGGIKDASNTLIPNINVPGDVERLLEQDWVKHGTRLKLTQIAELLESLGPEATVSVTSAASLMREMFTNQGAGTLFRRTENIKRVESLKDLDIPRLGELLETAFGRKLTPSYLQSLESRLVAAYVSSSYSGAAILTREEACPDVPYLCKFAVTERAQGSGLGQALWHSMVEENPQLYWRSRTENPLNTWYFQRADGSLRYGGWTVFWYHREVEVHSDDEEVLESVNDLGASPPRPNPTLTSELDIDFVQRVARAALSVPPSFEYHGPSSTPGGKRTYSTWTGAGPGRRSYSTSTRSAAAAPSNSRFGVAVVGARGYVGSELLSLLGHHSSLELKLAASRSLGGKPVVDVLPDHATEQARDNLGSLGLNFVDASPQQVAEAGGNGENIKLWFLALPNGHADEYAEPILAQDPTAVIVDLSADKRFDTTGRWVYGLSEFNRDALKNGHLVSNPGCYATGSQVAIRAALPFLAEGTAGNPYVFGVSGYSGAGTTPSDKNDPVKLKDNIMAYSLVNHIHEREVSRHLQRNVNFMPHVAAHFRGIHLTVAYR
ncbi:ARG5 [Symbiodinium sp. KB8]|nr:ARG5 [Symbiodinium sp. KB8]